MTTTRIQDPRETVKMNVLVVALGEITPADVDDAEVLVVAPAINSWLRRWLSDEDAARKQAEGRAAAVVARLEIRGVHAEGRAGDSDPLLAIADALPTVRADQIVIAAGSDRSAPPTAELVSRAQSRFGLPTSTQDNDHRNHEIRREAA
jgi:pyruvate/2-oxoglutarate dehydrogenase complex dihydrolipoamide dehydrogenase (E3) component